MAQTRELTFELERFEWVADDRLEIVGRWQGLTGRRLGRPLLYVDAGGHRRRLTATPGGHLPASGELWRAGFAWPHGPADLQGVELEIGRSLVVDLPAPRRRRRSSGESASDRGLRDELGALRAELAELRERHERMQAERDALGDQHAALIARGGELRGELDQTAEDRERLSEEVRGLREELDQRAPSRRMEAARAAAAQRVPEPEQSTAGVWATRAAAVALVAVLLLALAIIVTAVA